MSSDQVSLHNTQAPNTYANTKFKHVSDAQRQKDIKFWRAAQWNSRDAEMVNDTDIEQNTVTPNLFIVVLIVMYNCTT